MKALRAVFLVAFFFALGAPFSPRVDQTITVTGNATLTPTNAYVYVNAASAVITLPTTPANGTSHRITHTGTTFTSVSIAAGGADVIVASGTTSVPLSGPGSTCMLRYDGGTWRITNLQHQVVQYLWNGGAAANDYLPRNCTVAVLGGNCTFSGGAVGTAQGVLPIRGTIVSGSLVLQARANVAANRTIKVRTVTNLYASPADLTNTLQATIASGTAAGSAYALNVLTGSTSAAHSWLVLQATTAIAGGDSLDITLDYESF